MTNKEREAKVKAAIATAKRVSGKTPIILARYLNILERQRDWDAKEFRAARKLKFYNKKIAYYAKRTGL